MSNDGLSRDQVGADFMRQALPKLTDGSWRPRLAPQASPSARLGAVVISDKLIRAHQ